ncbi:MAG: 4-hydroxy-tetrahydrodipicolinate synthase [Bacteroidales bacterium]|jgi:4-hydroxy-tetrahydrodipicolinate synthase|nr:4-hydroxy-tetrahydrodipicolinate synthase [Bacteroidales bacterium]MBQ5411345.1 4-hydroxy-tetrahydrodipicolinate synthase [Bacteroidales bacterium]
MILRGCGTALVTPFRDGKVDFEAYGKMVRRQVEAGIDFLVPLGSTAETPCLEDDEKVELLRIARELCPDKPVVVGVGTNSPAATVRNIRLLEPLGPDAYLVVVPYYNKPTQEGIYRYFAHVAEATSKGIVAYNVPGRTGTNMKAATTLRVATIPNVIAVKEASGDLAQVKEVIDGRPEGFSVLSGNDDQTLQIISDGGDGVISVASNLAPGLMEEFVSAALGGDLAKAAELDRKLMPLYDGCFVESNPIPAKAGLSLLGLCTAEMRLPLTEAVPSTFDAMKRILADLD